jgi:hypothetical protein
MQLAAYCLHLQGTSCCSPTRLHGGISQRTINARLAYKGGLTACYREVWYSASKVVNKPAASLLTPARNVAETASLQALLGPGHWVLILQGCTR